MNPLYSFHPPMRVAQANVVITNLIERSEEDRRAYRLDIDRQTERQTDRGDNGVRWPSAWRSCTIWQLTPERTPLKKPRPGDTGNYFGNSSVQIQQKKLATSNTKKHTKDIVGGQPTRRRRRSRGRSYGRFAGGQTERQTDRTGTQNRQDRTKTTVE